MYGLLTAYFSLRPVPPKITQLKILKKIPENTPIHASIFLPLYTFPT